MAYIFDLNKCACGILTMDINPKGWVNPITIEYGVAQSNPCDTMLSVCWRVKGTTHTFTIYETYINNISNGDYAKHFTEVLEYFREDYLSWFSDKKYENCEWREEYKKQYQSLIKQ
jgi:hypothetical protein